MSYQNWWRDIGSGITPHEPDDMEAHANMVSSAAWDAATAEFFDSIIGFDFAAPDSERCIRIFVEDDILKIEEIPTSRVKDLESSLEYAIKEAEGWYDECRGKPLDTKEMRVAKKLLEKYKFESKGFKHT